MTRAHYATTTPFYRHVVAALNRNYESVDLQRRFQLDERTYRRLSTVAPKQIREVMERRVQPEVDADRVYTFHRSSFEPALYGRMGRPMSAQRFRSLIASTAKEVRNRSRRADVLQFTDGIGYLALRDKSRALTVMERRHVHHSVLMQPLTTWQGFPVRAKTERVADILDEEYATADVIVVYSDAARATFLKRGFDPGRVFTVHRAASTLPRVPGGLRDPRLAIYVGRGDADKGLDVAVGAVERLNGEAKLAVAGPMSKEVLNWLGKYRTVEYLGILNRTELARLYSRASLLLAPSIESFGLALTDAASVGVRVLCADTAGIGPELGPQFSSVIEGRDVEEWAENVSTELQLESDELRSERFASQAIQNRFSWINSEAAMDRLHRELKEAFRV